MSLRAALPVVFALAVACSAAPPTTPTISPTTTPQPTPTATPSPSPAPSPTAAGRVFTGADFTRSGGCGDVFMWAATEDDRMAVALQWEGAATTAWNESGLDETATLPQAGVLVSLVVGEMLSAGYCTDIGMPGHRIDGSAQAAAGTVELTVRPGAGSFKPSSHADVTLRDAVLEVFQGSAVEHWRIDLLELHDISVGWFAG